MEGQAMSDRDEALARYVRKTLEGDKSIDVGDCVRIKCDYWAMAHFLNGKVGTVRDLVDSHIHVEFTDPRLQEACVDYLGRAWTMLDRGAVTLAHPDEAQ